MLPRLWRHALDALFVEPNEYTSAFVHELVDRCSDADVRSLAAGLTDARADLLDRDAARTFEYVAAPTMMAWAAPTRWSIVRPLRAGRRSTGVEVRENSRLRDAADDRAPAEVVALLRDFVTVDDLPSDGSAQSARTRPAAALRPAGRAADAEAVVTGLQEETDRSAPVMPEATASAPVAAPEIPASRTSAPRRTRRLPRALL